MGRGESDIMDDEFIAHLQGQIAANQTLITLLLSTLANGKDDSKAFVELLRRDTLETFHRYSTPDDPYAEIVMQEAIEALDLAFDNLQSRLGNRP